MPAQPESLPGLPDDYVAKIFMGDVVTKFVNPSFRARVLRTWASDSDLDLPPLLPGEVRHPLDRQLLRGEVGLSEIGTDALSIVPESTLLLFHREFPTGDCVKRSLTAVESAIVLSSRSEVQAEHVITEERIRSWIPYEDLELAIPVEVGDHVIYDEWIGIIHDAFEDGVIKRHKDDSLYRYAERSGSLNPGSKLSATLKGLDALDKRPGMMAEDVVLTVTPVCLYVIWQAINQMLPISEQEKHPEPKKLWEGEELTKLKLLDVAGRDIPALRSRVRFKDPAKAEQHGVKTVVFGNVNKVHVDVLNITEIRTKVRLRWQDGTETEDWASELVPYHDIDDYEAWPGDHLLWLGDEEQKRSAVVQKFDPHQRVADLLFTDNDEKEVSTVPAMELDPGGQGRVHYGVSPGMLVLICKDSGCAPPIVPTLGQHVPLDDDVWHSHIDHKIESHHVGGGHLYDAKLPSNDTSDIDWVGSVERLNLDGTVMVKLYNGQTRQYSLKELTAVGDVGAAHGQDPLFMGMPTGQANFLDMFGGDFSDEEEGEEEDDQPWRDDDGNDVDMHSQASWETMSPVDTSPPVEPVTIVVRLPPRDDFDDAMSAQDADEVETKIVIDEEDPHHASAATTNGDASITQETARDAETKATPATPTIISTPAEAGPSTLNVPTGGGADAVPGPDGEGEPLEAFEVLETAPEDHHYISEPRHGAMSRTYLSRIQKEHRALSTSLPDNILVRAYEDRTDLMRVLIIGPEDTPYANAPFVFDVFLNPGNFPHSPPLVHFHSHTNGKGRCNPNLYEEGKVCLSILGTWSGDKSESWNMQSSSLLQVFVSISGLVLVRSPYHCEPAFAKLEGTREGKVNSRLYSEKAYVLSRSFVRTALLRPPAGLEKELNDLYFKKGRLRAVIDHAKRLMDKGEAGSEAEGEEMAEMWNADAMGSLTLGAIISLKRTIAALENMEAEHAAQMSS